MTIGPACLPRLVCSTRESSLAIALDAKEPWPVMGLEPRVLAESGVSPMAWLGPWALGFFVLKRVEWSVRDYGLWEYKIL